MVVSIDARFPVALLIGICFLLRPGGTAVAWADDPVAEAQTEARLSQLRKPLSTIRLESTATEASPPNRAASLMDQHDSLWITGGAANIPLPDRYSVGFRHRPLYFQELNLERCGLTYGCAQNLVSAGYFLGNTALLPYRMAAQRPDETVNHWGDCYSGHSYRHDIEPLSCSAKGLVHQAAVAAGFVFLLL